MQRRLAAILAADVTGYARLIGTDEEGTLARLRALFRDTVRPAIAAHGGRVFKLMGDAVFAEFPSAVEAVRCAVTLQEQVAAREPEDLRLRIGVHLGDVVVEGSDLLGDGVNVAARLEGEAAPGGIALSAAVAEAVRGRVPQLLEDLGERRLKNIERPVRVFGIGGAAAVPLHPALPDKPSLVVLPFQNMSGDAEQEYFTDGMVEDITTALSRIRWLFVIARNSAFTYKGRAVDVRQVGRELGVRYVVEGSVRRAGGRVRITAQLVEAETGRHIWADRFDESADDVFELQDRVTEAVARAVAPSLRSAELERSRRKLPGSLTAYDFYLQALPHHHAMTREGSAEALQYCEQALAMDPGYASASALSAVVLGYRVSQRWVEDRQHAWRTILKRARDAVKFDADDPEVLATGARAIAYVQDPRLEASGLADRALVLNPNSAIVLVQCGWTRLYEGRASESTMLLNLATRINPVDPMAYSVKTALAIAAIIDGRPDLAILHARRAVAQSPGFVTGLRALAAALAITGYRDDASEVVSRIMTLTPDARLASFFGHNIAVREAWRTFREGLRLAGLPE